MSGPGGAGRTGAGGRESQTWARFVPAEKLAIYFESDGLKPHEEGWHKTAAYRLLHETTAGAMFDDLAGQMIKLVLGREGRDRPRPTRSRRSSTMSRRTG